MKGTSRFMIMLLAFISLGIMSHPAQAIAAPNFSIMIDAYPIRFALWDSSPAPVYVEREVTYRSDRDDRGFRPRNDARRSQTYYNARGCGHNQYRHPGRHNGNGNWNNR